MFPVRFWPKAGTNIRPKGETMFPVPIATDKHHAQGVVTRRGATQWSTAKRLTARAWC